MSSSIRFNNENVETIPEITLRDAVKLTFTDVADTEMGIQAWEWEISPPQGNKSRHAEFEENFQFDLISLGYDIGGQYKVTVIDTSIDTELTSISLNVIMIHINIKSVLYMNNLIKA